MKKQQFFSIKTLAGILMTLVLVSLYSCGNNQSNSNTDTDQATTTKAPAVGIHEAAFMGNESALRQHIDAASDLNEKDQYGSTPLIIATTFNKTEIALLLIEAGADLSVTGNDGSTALHTAAFLCRTEIVEALLSKGADKTTKNNYGSTALESISTPFETVKPIYDQLSKDLGPLGFKLDYDYLESTRPLIADMLSE